MTALEWILQIAFIIGFIVLISTPRDVYVIIRILFIVLYILFIFRHELFKLYKRIRKKTTEKMGSDA